jgi:glycosyltransferase involved in cell wall biosynthesis
MHADLRESAVHASVIVPSYNSRTTITQCLHALGQQDTDYTYEIIVVDSSDDGTGDLIAAHFPAVKLLRMPQRTLPGLARNMGSDMASGDILAFTDADCVPEPLWVDKIVQTHAREDCIAVGGAVLNGLPCNPVAWSGYLLEFSDRLPSFPKRFVDMLPTCNVAFKRQVFKRYGLFPTELWPSEDHIFSWRLWHAGERLLFDPTIGVRHLFRPRFSAFVQHQLRLGKASAMARRQVDLPHAWITNHPLRWLTPLLRLLRIEARLARWDLANFLRFNCLLPLCLPGLLAWGMGFCSASSTGNSPHATRRKRSA